MEPHGLGKLALFCAGHSGSVLYRMGLLYGGYKSLRNKSANMDVLVALGSTVAYVYSVAVLLNPVWGEHVYFETSAIIITLIKLGKMLEARTKGKTGVAIRKLIGLQPKTAKSWFEVLERMYLVFSVRPYTKSLPRAVLKPPKFIFLTMAMFLAMKVPGLKTLWRHL